MSLQTVVANASREVLIDGAAWADVRECRFVATVIIYDGKIPRPGDSVCFNSPPLRVEGTVETVHVITKVGYLQRAILRGECVAEARDVSGMYGSGSMSVELRGEKTTGCTHFTIVEAA